MNVSFGSGFVSRFRLDRTVSEALMAAFAIAKVKPPKLIVGPAPGGEDWVYDEANGKFFVPLMPHDTMDDEQEHLFRAAIGHAIIGGRRITETHDRVSRDANNIRPELLIGPSHSRTDWEGRQMVEALAHGLANGAVNAEVVERWPGMERSMRRSYEKQAYDAIARIAKRHKIKDRVPTFDELAQLAGYASMGGDLPKLAEKLRKLPKPPATIIDACEKFDEAARVVGVPKKASEALDYAVKWLQYLDEPEPDTNEPEPEPEDDEDDAGSEGEGEGDAESGESPPEPGTGSAPPPPAGTPTPSTNPFDQAQCLATGSGNPGFSQQMGQAMSANADPGEGMCSPDWQGEPLVHAWPKAKEILANFDSVSARAEHASLRRNIAEPERPSWIASVVGWWSRFYDRDVGVLGQALRQALRGPTLSRQSRHALGRFNTREVARAVAGNRDVFDRVTYLPGEKVAVTLLVDGSGSMASYQPAGETAATTAHRAACVMVEALHRMGVHARYVGYDSAYQGCRMLELATPDTTRAEFAKRRELIAEHVLAGGGTPTLPALAHELGLLQKRDESRRFLFVITDGEAAGADAQAEAIRVARARNVTTIYFAIGGAARHWDELRTELNGAGLVIEVPPEDVGPAVARSLVKALLADRTQGVRA